MYVQSSIDSVKAVTQVQVGVESLQKFSKYDGEVVLGSSESKSRIASPSSQSINSEPSLFIEEKSDISSPVQVHSYSEVSTFTEEELQKVLEIAPFLDRTLLIEEYIAYILQNFKKNLDYFTSLQSRQCFVDFPSNFTVGSSSSFFPSEGLVESISPRSEEVLDSGQSLEDLKNLVNSQPPVSSPKISTNIQTSGQPSLSLPLVMQIPTTLNPLIVHIVPVMAQPPTRMELTVATRYAPLAFPQPLNPLPPGDYLKYFPKFMGEGTGLTAKEHLATFYSYADNLNIEHEDVSTRLFVQRMDGEARKWFRDLPASSIAGIEALDEAFLKQWGDRKDYLYYITKFGSLKRKEGESLIDFTKRFNKVY